MIIPKSPPQGLRPDPQGNSRFPGRLFFWNGLKALPLRRFALDHPRPNRLYQPPHHPLEPASGTFARFARPLWPPTNQRREDN